MVLFLTLSQNINSSFSANGLLQNVIKARKFFMLLLTFYQTNWSVLIHNLLHAENVDKSNGPTYTLLVR